MFNYIRVVNDAGINYFQIISDRDKTVQYSDIQPFPTYKTSAADYFEDTSANIWQIFIIEDIIV